MKKIRQLLRLVSGYKPLVLQNILLNILGAFLSVFTFAALIPLLHVLFGENEEAVALPQGGSTWSFEYWYQTGIYHLDTYIQENGAFQALIYICVCVVILSLLKNLVTYFSLFSIANIRVGVSRDIRKRLYYKLLRLPLSYYSNERKGDIISRATNDLFEVEFSTIGTIEAVFKSPVLILVYLIMLILMSWKLTIFAFVFLPLSGMLISVIAKSLKYAANQGKIKLSEIITIFEETIGGLRIIKGFNAQDQFENKFNSENESYFRLMVRLYKKEYLSSPLSEFISIVVLATLLGFGGYLILSSDTWMKGSTFISYLAIFSQIIPPAKVLADAFFKMNKGAASLERIEEILNAPETIQDKTDAKELTGFNEEIEFKNIGFAYDEKSVIDGISFSIKKGETVALVGPSGGGKSTLANLAARFFDVSKGSITIDGNDLRDLKQQSFLAHMGIVSQQSVLFNDSVARNIALGDQNLDIEKVKKAAAIANAEEFIVKLEDQFEFVVGDSGDKLSGGQKQRLSIARAVYKNPDILILDEATSALDTESERLVQDAINKLMQNRTSLVIAHRLSTIQNADKILVIENGKISEQGTHEELTAKEGTYAKLVQMQNFS